MTFTISGLTGYPTDDLQPGNTVYNSDVYALQEWLVKNGFLTQTQVDSGPGIYGPQTTVAVESLQAALGVNAGAYPGYYGPATIAAVQSELTALETPTVTAQTLGQTWTIGQAVDFILASNAFTDPQSESLTYTAGLAGGGALPSWLSFSGGTRTFTGTVPNTATSLNIKVTATDTQGLSASETFGVTVAALAYADLVPENITVASSVAPGAPLPVSWTISNEGSGAANSSTTVLRINQSSTNAAPVDDLASVNTPGLGPGASSSTESATLTAPTTPGVYDLWVIADNYGTANQDGSPANNLQHVQFTVTGGGGGSVEYGVDYRAEVNIGTSANPVYQYYNPASYNTSYGYTDPNPYINPQDIKAATYDGSNYSFAMEYMGQTQSQGYLRPSDVTALEGAGLSIVSIFERDPSSIAYFTGTTNGMSNADYDAADALADASALGQTAHSAIYFTVDYEAISSADQSAITAYFAEIQKDFIAAGSSYTIGVYGDGNVLNWISTDANLSLVKDFWLAYGWSSLPLSNTSGYSSETIKQDYSSPIYIGPNNRDVDLDIAYTSEFGQWGGASSDVISEAAPTSTVAATAGVSTPISGVLVSDPGGANDTFTTVVSAANDGAISASATGGATVSNSGTSRLTISGTLSQVNAALDTLTYTNASAVSDTVTVQTSDPNASNSPVSQNFGVTVTAPAKPDLIAYLNNSSMTAAAGSALHLDVWTDNLGTGAAGSSTTAIYLSTDQTITTSDTLLGTLSVGALAAENGANWYNEQSFTANLAANLAPGTYYLGGLADYNGQISESNESNNNYNTVQLTVTAPAKPDLIAYLNNSSMTATAGSALHLDVWTDNFGTGAAGSSTTAIYLSTDQTITTSDTLLGTLSVGALAAENGANWYNEQSFTANLAANLAPGTYYLGGLADYNGQISESNESNNNYNTVQLTVTAPAKPDLIAYLNNSAMTAAAGSALHLDVWTDNFGTGAAGSSTTAIYLSTDQTITTSDTLLGTLSVGALAAENGANWYNEQSFTANLAANLAPGTYYLGGLADYNGQISESNESNNNYNTVQLTVTAPAKPDLIAYLNNSSMTATAGSALHLDVWTDNFGTGAAGSSTTAIYLSTDQTITTSDTLLGTLSVGALAAENGANWYNEQSFTANLAANLAPGTYYLGGLADYNGQISESNESNNNYNTVQLTVTAPAKPDLIAYLNNSSMTATAGSAIHLDVWTDNLGTGAAGSSTTAIYLSTDQTITTSDTLLGTLSVGALAAENGANWYNEQSFTANLAANLAPGTYYLGGLADYNGQISESNESNNNYNTVQLTVTAPAKPDLIAYLNNSSMTATAGSALHLDVWTDNFGTGAAGSSTTAIYLSTDQTITTSDTLLGTLSVGALAAENGANWYNEQSFTANLAANLAPGTYYLGGLADYNGQISESNESNNNYNTVQLTVTAPAKPDLIAYLNNSSMTATAGSAIHLDVWTDNFGTGAAGSSTTAIYLSTDQTITTSDTLLGTLSVGALAAENGANWYNEQSFTANLAANLAPGTYYLGGLADYNGQISESNESNNNYNTVQLTVTAPAKPDLIAYLNNSSMTATAGSALHLDVWTDNFGTGAAGSSTTAIYLSTDQTITTSDTLLGTLSVGALAAENGANWYNEQSFTANLAANLAPGTYYLGGLADYNGQISESNESNNNYNTVQLTVTAPANYTYAQKSISGATDYYYVMGGNIIQENSGGSISWRNNNPGNITYVGQSSAIGSYLDSSVNLTFAVFPNYAAGVQAAEQLLEGGLYVGDGLSINAAMAKWTNDSGQALQNYEQIVDSAVGLSGSTLLSALTQTQMYTLVTQGIQIAEGWTLGTTTYSGTSQDEVSGTESEVVAANATLDIATAYAGAVTFAGSTGILQLDNPSTFTGDIAGFTGNGTLLDSDQIDLQGINYNSVHDSYGGGVLTVSDGNGDAAKLDFVGTYSLANFEFASDGNGGTIVYDPPVPGAKPSSPGQATAANCLPAGQTAFSSAPSGNGVGAPWTVHDDWHGSAGAPSSNTLALNVQQNPRPHG